MNKSKPEKFLKADKNFTPLPVDDGDEMFHNGIFIFNITKMIEYIKSNPELFKPEKIIIEDYPEQFSSITELIKISIGIAAAFTCGFPFSYILSNKIFNISNSNSENRKIVAIMFFGIAINFIFAAAVFYMTLFYTNEHFLSIINF